jgi:hypothetical protein
VIRNRESQEVVTVLELLSPWNKLASQDRRRYLAKRQRLLASPVHLVEIDLLRGRGARMPVRGLPPCDYCALVSRAAARPTVGLWPVRLADRLPVLPVPLRAPAADAKLDLQALVHQIYDAGGYADYLYRRPPRPRLTPEQLAWAQAFLPGGTPPGPTAATPAP